MSLTLTTLLVVMFALGLAIGVVVAVGALLYFQVCKYKYIITKISAVHGYALTSTLEYATKFDITTKRKKNHDLGINFFILIKKVRK